MKPDEELKARMMAEMEATARQVLEAAGAQGGHEPLEAAPAESQETEGHDDPHHQDEVPADGDDGVAAPGFQGKPLEDGDLEDARNVVRSEEGGLITAMNWVLTCERYKSFCKDRKLWKTT